MWREDFKFMIKFAPSLTWILMKSLLKSFIRFTYFLLRSNTHIRLQANIISFYCFWDFWNCNVKTKNLRALSKLINSSQVMPSDAEWFWTSLFRQVLNEFLSACCMKTLLKTVYTNRNSKWMIMKKLEAFSFKNSEVQHAVKLAAVLKA